jgi:hypothetical protein
LEFCGCKHSGDWYGKINRGALARGSSARETIEVDVETVRAGVEGTDGRRKVAYVVVGVFSWGGQDMDAIPKAFTYVANPQMRGTGPGGMQHASILQNIPEFDENANKLNLVLNSVHES